jgi:RNA polymerase sigma factor (sigma-70 family)
MATKEQNIEKTFHQEQNRLTNFIRNKIGSLEDAEDLVQDVFLSFIGAFDDISDLRKSISWIYSVAKNKIVDYRRKKRPELIDESKKDEDEDKSLNLLDQIPSIAPSPDEQMMLDTIWDEIQYRLAELPDEQKKVFEWHELEGFNFQQISDFTGQTVNTLISRKRYAVLYLREHLKEMFKYINER